jgi:predicted nucleotidyltransferase component of viral defense system
VNLTLATRGVEQSVAGSTTLLIDYVGPLSARLGSRHLKVDVTRGELLLDPPVDRALHAPYSDYPSGTMLPTYTLVEILIEKLCALMGRTEPRDLYDVYWLFEWGDVDIGSVLGGFPAKARHKGQERDRLDEALSRKEDTLGRLWRSRLALQVRDLPDFDEIIRVVRRHLRTMGLI